MTAVGKNKLLVCHNLLVPGFAISSSAEEQGRNTCKGNRYDALQRPASFSGPQGDSVEGLLGGIGHERVAVMGVGRKISRPGN